MVEDSGNSRAGDGSDDRGDDPVADETSVDGSDPWGTVDDAVRQDVERDEPAGGDGAGADDPLGPEPNSARVLPGDPNLENAFFVVVGMIAMALVLVRLGSLGL